MKTDFLVSVPDSSNYLNILNSIAMSKTMSIVTKGNVVDLYLDAAQTNCLEFSLNIFSSMMSILGNFVVTETLDYSYYKRPKAFCMDKYGSVEIYDFIMYLNGCLHPSNFKMDTVKFLTTGGIKQYLSLIDQYSQVQTEQILKPFRQLD